MKEQLVSIETAKLAKEKGFDIKCENFYNKFSGYKNQNDPILRTGIDEIYEAPSQSVLQKWLREVHKIHPDIWYNTLTKKWRTDTIMLLLDDIKQFDENNETEYLTYEETLEVALQQCLNLIK